MFTNMYLGLFIRYTSYSEYLFHPTHKLRSNFCPEFSYSHRWNSVDPDQLASEKPADQDPHCYQNWVYIYNLSVF